MLHFDRFCLSLALFFLILAPAFGRAVPKWYYSRDEITRRADLIIIARPQATSDVAEFNDAKAKSGPVVPAETIFSVQAMLKGRLDGPRVTVRHNRLRGNGHFLFDSPNAVVFNLQRPNQYLVFLKQTPSGGYEPVTEEDASASFFLLQHYDYFLEQGKR